MPAEIDVKDEDVTEHEYMDVNGRAFTRCIRQCLPALQSLPTPNSSHSAGVVITVPIYDPQPF